MSFINHSIKNWPEFYVIKNGIITRVITKIEWQCLRLHIAYVWALRLSVRWGYVCPHFPMGVRMPSLPDGATYALTFMVSLVR